MARYKPTRSRRLQWLLDVNFTPKEARELSVLPRNTPALRRMVADRADRRARFEKIAARKLNEGRWRWADVREKWLQNLSRMYYRRGWRVQYGAVGAQQKMPVGSPNVWAMYRGAIKDTGGDKAQRWISPWQLRSVSKGKTPLDKGALLSRKAVVSGASAPMVREWQAQIKQSMVGTSGARRQQLQAQHDRLGKLVGGR